jgi:hypothetical protein
VIRFLERTAFQVRRRRRAQQVQIDADGLKTEIDSL